MSEEQQERRINVKQAVSIAGDVIRDLYEDVNINDLLLEEVRRGDIDSWLITMSFTRPARPGAGLGGAAAGIIAPPRSYKQVEIGADGEFREMEIRTLPKPPDPGRASGY